MSARSLVRGKTATVPVASYASDWMTSAGRGLPRSPGKATLTMLLLFIGRPILGEVQQCRVQETLQLRIARICLGGKQRLAMSFFGKAGCRYVGQPYLDRPQALRPQRLPPLLYSLVDR